MVLFSIARYENVLRNQIYASQIRPNDHFRLRIAQFTAKPMPQNKKKAYVVNIRQFYKCICGVSFFRQNRHREPIDNPRREDLKPYLRPKITFFREQKYPINSYRVKRFWQLVQRVAGGSYEQPRSPRAKSNGRDSNY